LRGGDGGKSKADHHEEMFHWWVPSRWSST
jgi:hypothetical protein